MTQTTQKQVNTYNTYLNAGTPREPVNPAPQLPRNARIIARLQQQQRAAIAAGGIVGTVAGASVLVSVGSLPIVTAIVMAGAAATTAVVVSCCLGEKDVATAIQSAPSAFLFGFSGGQLATSTLTTTAAFATGNSALLQFSASTLGLSSMAAWAARKCMARQQHTVQQPASSTATPTPAAAAASPSSREMLSAYQRHQQLLSRATSLSTSPATSTPKYK